MKRLVTTFVLVFITWLVLTFSLATEQVVAGVFVSLAITVICRHLLSSETPRIILHPKRWLFFLSYLGFMVYVEVLAHWDVAKRVVSGRVRPAIVEVPVEFKTLLGKTLLGNSITLTPGTLTVDVSRERKFYVHTLAYSKDREIGKAFHRHGLKVVS